MKITHTDLDGTITNIEAATPLECLNKLLDAKGIKERGYEGAAKLKQPIADVHFDYDMLQVPLENYKGSDPIFKSLRDYL